MQDISVLNLCISFFSQDGGWRLHRAAQKMPVYRASESRQRYLYVSDAVFIIRILSGVGGRG